jgi:hypothetical protein
VQGCIISVLSPWGLGAKVDLHVVSSENNEKEEKENRLNEAGGPISKSSQVVGLSRMPWTASLNGAPAIHSEAAPPHNRGCHTVQAWLNAIGSTATAYISLMAGLITSMKELL